MTPDERQLLSGLFDRIRTASTSPRDRDAESFIGDAVRTQPYAPYLLAQTVIVQEQALRAANERLQELEAKVQAQEQGQHGGGQDTSFLGNIGRSIFGGNDQPQARGSVPSAGGYAPQGQAGYPPQGQGGYNQGGGGFGQQAPQNGPWGGQGGAAPGGGGGFLKGALGMAAGVAGGALLGNAVSGLFRGSNNPFGIASGMPGMGGGFGGYPGGGGETIVNNYYEGDSGAGGGYGAADDGNFDPAADFGPSDASQGSDDDYNV